MANSKTRSNSQPEIKNSAVGLSQCPYENNGRQQQTLASVRQEPWSSAVVPNLFKAAEHLRLEKSPAEHSRLFKKSCRTLITN